LSLLEELEARGYWEFLLILLLRSRHWRFVGEAMNRFLAEKALADLRRNGLRRELEAFARLLARPAP